MNQDLQIDFQVHSGFQNANNRKSSTRNKYNKLSLGQQEGSKGSTDASNYDKAAINLNFLTINQLQGKYNNILSPKAGHTPRNKTGATCISSRKNSQIRNNLLSI